METQTRFDLNAAIANWQQELAAQSNLTPDVRRELETHLRDSTAELRQRGLNDEESFWLARRRVGQPQQLSEEFAKADPARVWRERVFWIVLGLLVVHLWLGTAAYIWGIVIRPITTNFLTHNHLLPEWILFYLPFLSAGNLNGILGGQFVYMLFILLPMIWLVVLLAQGRMSRVASAIQFLFRSRRRFVFVSAALFLIHYLWFLYVLLGYAEQTASVPGNPSVDFVIQSFFARSLLPVALVALIAWLLPTGKSPTQTRT